MEPKQGKNFPVNDINTSDVDVVHPMTDKNTFLFTQTAEENFSVDFINLTTEERKIQLEKNKLITWAAMHERCPDFVEMLLECKQENGSIESCYRSLTRLGHCTAAEFCLNDYKRLRKTCIFRRSEQCIQAMRTLEMCMSQRNIPYAIRSAALK
jgi:hypothetical protein